MSEETNERQNSTTYLDSMIGAHLRSALRRIDCGEFRLAQVNVEYARNRLRDALGALPTEKEMNDHAE